ncbi:hypothetical protein Glove_310g59 [Diversispora epigaea]|uniref:Fork-head domain-containing protein n=1 Tax=Diversispora epigaea TaxID=1348612 RepID=A0A397HXX4_9GLOM|nr:hypothetical protein Glove_310g59 [Diversispora epigaea]
MPIIISGQTGIMTTENKQRVGQEGSNSINNDNASVDQPKLSLTYKSLIGQAIWLLLIRNNAIRHNLTLCPAFSRCERDGGKRRKKAWTIPDEYQECFAKEIKAREESASAIGSEETISSSNEVPKLTLPSQESSTNQSQSSRLSTSSPNLSTAPTQSIYDSGSIHTLHQSEIVYNIIVRYLNASEESSSSSPAPCNYVNMAKVENIQDNGILNYEIKETEANKIEIPTWELDPEKLVQVSQEPAFLIHAFKFNNSNPVMGKFSSRNQFIRTHSVKLFVGVISLKKDPIEGRRVFKNKMGGILLVLEKNGEVIKSPSEYSYKYNSGNKTENIQNPMYTMMSLVALFSISKPKCIFGYNRKNKDIFSKIDNILGVGDYADNEQENDNNNDIKEESN